MLTALQDVLDQGCMQRLHPEWRVLVERKVTPMQFHQNAESIDLKRSIYHFKTMEPSWKWVSIYLSAKQFKTRTQV